jgi:hypothetical protein
MRKTSLISVAFALAAITALLTAGSAAGADKNRDRIPDKWEKKNHLSLRVNQAPKDQDRDGLTNAGEYADHTDPHNPDSDSDGVSDSADDDNHDGDETEPPAPPTNGDGLPGGNAQAGTVVSYDGGVLTIEMFTGGTITGNVNGDTRYRCIVTTGDSTHQSEPVSGDEHPSTDPSDEPGTEPGDDPPGDEPGDDSPGDEPGDDPPGDEPSGDPTPAPCDSADLVPGTLVHEANIEDGDFVLLVLVT